MSVKRHQEIEKAVWVGILLFLVGGFTVFWFYAGPVVIAIDYSTTQPFEQITNTVWYDGFVWILGIVWAGSVIGIPILMANYKAELAWKLSGLVIGVFALLIIGAAWLLETRGTHDELGALQIELQEHAICCSHFGWLHDKIEAES